MFIIIIIGILLFMQIILVVFMVLLVYWLIRGSFGVPWIRSKNVFSEAMLELAGVKEGDMVVDFGSGDGSVVIMAAKKYKARGIGYEYLGMLILLAKIRAYISGVSNRVTFTHKNFLRAEKLPPADVICSYLYPEVNERLEPLLKRDYPSGTRVVSRTFLFPTLTLVAAKEVKGEKIYLYEI